MTTQERAAMQAAYDWMTSHGGVVFAGGGMQALDPMNAAALGLRQALAAPALLLAAPVTDDEIDAAFDALGLIRESTTAGEVRRMLEGFAVGRTARPAPTVVQPRLMPFWATERGRCTSESHCMCGGDTPRVRETCPQWVKRPGLSKPQLVAPRLTAEERTSMTQPQIDAMMNNMGIYDGDYETAIVRAVEKHHEIKGATQ